MASVLQLLQLMCILVVIDRPGTSSSAALLRSLTHVIIKGTIAKNVGNFSTGISPLGSLVTTSTMSPAGNTIDFGRRLNAEEIALPDHLAGVRIERDGELNREFRKEVLLGVRELNVDKDLDLLNGPLSSRRHDSIINAKTDKKFKPNHAEQLITKVFRKTDESKDGLLTVSELSSWIASKVNDHLDKAIKSNFNIFMTIDKDHNGLVTWDEYHRRYLLDKGYDAKYVAGHSEKHKDMSRQMREEILLDEAGFADAARTDEEGLNIDEFLSFRHPEHSHATLLNMANDIFDKLDENGDDFLSAAEFVSLNQDDDVNRRSPRMSHEMWKTEREREFIEVIDSNKDSKVTRQELVMYSDPKNPSHALMEAKSLVDAADMNRDGKLSLAEVIANMDLFLGSKMVDISKKIHDEF